MLFYIVYISIIAIILLTDYFSGITNRKITMMALLFVIIISGIREDVGYDFRNYVSFYLRENSPEFGFNLVNKGLKLFGLNYNSMFFLFSFMTIMFVCKGIESYTHHTRIAFLIYMLIPGLYLNSFSIVRQSIAIAVLFYGYRFLVNKEKRKYIITIILASGFHYSSLLTIPFFLLSLKAIRIKEWMYLFMIIGSLCLARLNLITVIFGHILGSTRYVAYATYDDAGTSFLKILVLNIFILILLLLYKKMNSIDKKMYFLAVLGTSIVTIFGSVGAVTRFSYYFRIFEIVLVADMIYLFKKKDIRLIMIILLMTGYYGPIFYNSLLVDTKLGSSPKITPYKTFLEK